MRGYLMLLFVALGLSGCATGVMSEKECLAADWYSAGLEDGAKGLTEIAFDNRAAQCVGFGAPPPDGAAYLEGRRVALFRLCTDEGGYDYGRSGRIYRGVCRAEREGDFLGGYLSGRRIYGFEAQRDAAQSNYNSIVSSLDSARYTIKSSRRILKDKEASEKKKEKAHKRLRAARERIPGLENNLDTALYTLGRADEAFAQALASSADWRRGFDFERALEGLQGVHAVAREEEAIDVCTDELPNFAPTCNVRDGLSVTDDVSGQICAVGPGDARLVSRRALGPDRADGAILSFEYYPDSLNSGLQSLFGRRAGGEFDVTLDGKGGVLSLSCPAGVFPEAP